MLSTAVSGSVSDATKVAPTISVTHCVFVIQYDNGSVSSPITVAAGATSADISFSSNPAPILLMFGGEHDRPDQSLSRGLVVAIGGQASAPGGRATNSNVDIFPSANLNFVNYYQSTGSTNQTFYHRGHQTISGNIIESIGDFDPPGLEDPPNGNPIEGYPNQPGVLRTIQGDGSRFIDVGGGGMLLVTNSPVEEGEEPSATGLFHFRNNTIAALNRYTGMYTTGPSSDVVFKIKMVT